MTVDLFHFDSGLLDTPEAKRAHRIGLLRAKSEALTSANRLSVVARPLLFGVLGVSFVHIWHQIALIKPASVPALTLDPWFYHVTAALLTLCVDAVALYLVSTRSTSAYAGDTRQHKAVWFFYVLTALLNGIFVLNYAPNLPDWITALVPLLNLVTAILLALLIPVSISAVETAYQTVEAARLALLVEVATLEGIVNAERPTAPRVSAPASPQRAEAHDPALDTPEARSALLAAPEAPPAPLWGEGAVHASIAEALAHGAPSVAVDLDKPASAITCPHCGAALKDAGAKGRAVRYGYCSACKPETDR
jgi:hypothetical protein